jgi:ABC-2 type transport system permease protein
VTLREPAALRDESVSLTPEAAIAQRRVVVTRPSRGLAGFLKKTLTIAEWEARKILHDPSDLVTRAVQPLLWLLVFGQVFARTRAIATGNTPYQDFLAPGILAQSILFLSIFYGIAVIWERDLGVIHKFLASPTPRGALVLGKAISAGLRGLPQAVIIYLLSIVLGVHMNFNPLAIAAMLVMVFLGAACFSTFSVIVACSLRTRERVMGIGQVLTMPLFFASNAIYPISLMPGWLQVISRLNPLSYLVDALRTLMLADQPSTLGLGTDFAVLLVVTTALIVLAARLYPKLIR